MAKKINKEKLISNTAELFKKCGYHNTSISDIASACKLSKASVYHYTPSKVALAKATLLCQFEYFKKNIFVHFYDSEAQAKERMIAVSEALKTFYADYSNGCLMGNMAVEVTGTIAELEVVIKDYFSEWINAIAYLLKAQYENVKAQEIAEDLVCQLHGALILCRLHSSQKPLLRVCDRLIALAEEDGVVLATKPIGDMSNLDDSKPCSFDS